MELQEPTKSSLLTDDAEQEDEGEEEEVELRKQRNFEKKTRIRRSEEEKMEEASNKWSLVDKLIDSELEWRQLICEANGSEHCLSELSEMQIKRQEVIHELVQTERHHCLTLALMRQVYLNGLKRLNELRLSSEQQLVSKPDSGVPQSVDLAPIDLERLFPALEDLIQAHELFFAHLRLSLVESCNKRAPIAGLVGRLGELLCDQFRLKHEREGKGNGQKLLQAYSKFCGQHYDSSRYYKHLMQSDKGFKQFIETCNKQNVACRQRGILECNLLVTQRLTKYPLLIEQLIKSSKDDLEEERTLRLALSECKSLLAELNNQLARKESFERLLAIYAQFCPKSYTIYNRHLKFTKHDLLQHKRLRQLLHSDDQIRIWSATRRKLFQVLCLILNDIIVFLRVESSSPQQHQHHLAAAEAANSQQQQVLLELEAPLQGALISANHASSQQTSTQVASAHAQAQTSAFSVKYCFANVDNKSSVISLSKLLVREKAINDEQPRIYLISSSPRQPEMYELAFVSKRHQVSFVEKLKSCVEQHTKSSLDSEHLEELEDELEFETLCIHQQQQQQLHSLQPSEEEGSNYEDELSAHETIEPFELDIEQDVITKPKSEEQEEPRGSGGGSGGGSGPPSEKVCPSVSGSTAGESSDTDHDLGGSESNLQLGSNESGLSERAKDSLDEAAPCRQKLRTNRRRRAQRPRNISNQSSSSSEAAHLQAIKLISGESVNGNESAPGAFEEEFDSGRGQDDSSSAASTSSNSLRAGLGALDNKPAAPTSSLPPAHSASILQPIEASKPAKSLTQIGGPSAQTEGKRQHQSLVAPNSSASSTASSMSALNKSNLVKCSSVLSKSSCSFAKQQHQRKLSTVSSMSSQLKLFAKLKSNATFGANQSQQCCADCQQQNQSSVLIKQIQHNQTNCSFSKQARQQLRRSSFVPEQKLEELRDLRIQLDKDKQEWQAKFNRMQEQLLNERRELDLARDKLKQDRQQVANEREQLYRKLDVLKERGILLSPSHKVIITTPELQLLYPAASNNVEQQQSRTVLASNSGQVRQPLRNLNCNSIQINSTRQQNVQQNNSSYSVNTIKESQPQSAATNLFIQSLSAQTSGNGQPKVPLHLSEQSSNNSRVNLTFNKLPPLMQVLSGSILTGGGSAKNGPHLESHLI